MNDATGRKLKEGQQADVIITGVVRGHVVKIVESAIQLSMESGIPPHALIMVQLSLVARPDGGIQGLYIVGEQNPTQKPNLQVVS